METFEKTDYNHIEKLYNIYVYKKPTEIYIKIIDKTSSCIYKNFITSDKLENVYTTTLDEGYQIIKNCIDKKNGYELKIENNNEEINTIFKKIDIDEAFEKIIPLTLNKTTTNSINTNFILKIDKDIRNIKEEINTIKEDMNELKSQITDINNTVMTFIEIPLFTTTKQVGSFYSKLNEKKIILYFNNYPITLTDYIDPVTINIIKNINNTRENIYTNKSYKPLNSYESKYNNNMDKLLYLEDLTIFVNDYNYHVDENNINTINYDYNTSYNNIKKLKTFKLIRYEKSTNTIFHLPNLSKNYNLTNIQIINYNNENIVPILLKECKKWNELINLRKIIIKNCLIIENSDYKELLLVCEKLNCKLTIENNIL